MKTETEIEFVNPLHPNITLIISASTENEYRSWQGGHQEAGLIAWAKETFASPGKAFVDIGAHCGIWSLHLCDAFRRTYAFEPDPVNFARFARGAAISNVPKYRIQMSNLALGEAPGYLTLRALSHGNRGDSSFAQYSGVSDGIDRVDVTVCTASDSIQDRSIGLVKIDVEGFEYEVLRGARQFLIESELPPILFESWSDPNRGQRPFSDVKALLESYGYDVNPINWPEEYIATRRS